MDLHLSPAEWFPWEYGLNPQQRSSGDQERWLETCNYIPWGHSHFLSCKLERSTRRLLHPCCNWWVDCRQDSIICCGPVWEWVCTYVSVWYMYSILSLYVYMNMYSHVIVQIMLHSLTHTTQYMKSHYSYMYACISTCIALLKFWYTH